MIVGEKNISDKLSHSKVLKVNSYFVSGLDIEMLRCSVAKGYRQPLTCQEYMSRAVRLLDSSPLISWHVAVRLGL